MGRNNQQSYYRAICNWQKHNRGNQLRFVNKDFSSSVPDFNSVWFQQETHLIIIGKLLSLLDQVFPDHLICSRDAIEWVTRSLDLNLCFFFWLIKKNIYKTKPVNIEELTNLIMQESRSETPEMLHNVTTAVFL